MSSGGVATPARNRRLARVFSVCVVAALAVGALVNEMRGGISDDGLVFRTVFAAFLAVGALLVVRVPDNRLPWFMLTIAFRVRGVGG